MDQLSYIKGHNWLLGFRRYKKKRTELFIPKSQGDFLCFIPPLNLNSCYDAWYLYRPNI